MEEIKLRFNISCPHCGTKLTAETSVFSDELPKGQFAEQCENCWHLFVVAWSVTLECQIFRCDKERSDKSSFGEICLGIDDYVVDEVEA